MMKQTLGINPKSKDEGLRAFAKSGFLLLDATYRPVNDLPEGRTRDRIIEDDFPALVEELREYAEPETKVILVKKNVCNLLVHKLKNLKQFKVLNSEKIVPYPGCGQQSKFGNMVRPMLALLSQFEPIKPAQTIPGPSLAST
jgi:hypothetical protein